MGGKFEKQRERVQSCVRQRGGFRKKMNPPLWRVGTDPSDSHTDSFPYAESFSVRKSFCSSGGRILGGTVSVWSFDNLNELDESKNPNSYSRQSWRSPWKYATCNDDDGCFKIKSSLVPLVEGVEETWMCPRMCFRRIKPQPLSIQKSASLVVSLLSFTLVTSNTYICPHLPTFCEFSCVEQNYFSCVRRSARTWQAVMARMNESCHTLHVTHHMPMSLTRKRGTLCLNEQWLWLPLVVYERALSHMNAAGRKAHTN